MKIPVSEANVSSYPIAPLWLTCSLFSFFLLSCDDNVPDDLIDYLDFQIVFLDENQNEKAAFEEGSDVRISLKIINNSQSAIQWRHDYTCMLLQSEDFLVVNKRSEISANYMEVGRPYETPLFCAALNLPPQNISQGESILIALPWSTNPGNEPLTSGEYYSTAKFSLEITRRTRNWDLRKDFAIE